MPVLEIEKVYQTEEEIEEYRKAVADLEGLRFAEDCLWDLRVPEILEKREAVRRQMEAWSRLSRLLRDLTSEERQRFDEGVRRRPFFDDED